MTSVSGARPPTAVSRRHTNTPAVETASTARSTLIALRESLTLSQQEKKDKLIYDVIATDILSNRALKPRAEQHVNLDRLNKEIADLEAEREEYRTVWAARRAQFGQIVDQLEKMWAQIKEDKDEQGMSRPTQNLWLAPVSFSLRF